MNVHTRRAVAATLALAAGIAVASPSLAARSTERLGTSVVPTSQDIALDLDPAREDYDGTTTIELDVKEPVRSFRLHAEGMDVPDAVLSREGDRLEPRVERVADDVIELGLPAPLAKGAWTLELGFHRPYGTKSTGLYKVVEDGRDYLYTQFESDDAREAFPCFDEPGFKIPFRLTLSVPDGLTAVSNTSPESETVKDGVRTVAFGRTRPLPSYLVAIAVGPFDVVEIPGTSVPARVIAPAGKAGLTGLAVETTPPILAALERWFDGRLPYDKIDLIAVPKFWPGAMENAGAITYRDDVLLVDPARVGPSQRRRLASISAHELAHQWFGDLVTMEWWDDLWLNESFADWMGNKITDEVYPELQTGLSDIEGAQRTMESDARPSTKAIRREVRPNDPLMEGVGLAYAKGRTVLAMVEGWMGAETMRGGVLDYLQRHEWGNAVAADLWEALDAASGRNVSGAIAGFLDQPGYPLVRVEPLGGGRVRLSQSRFHNADVELESLQWSVPVVLRWSESGSVRARSVLLDSDSREVDLETASPIEWIYPNGGGSGYYRWWVPPDRLAALAAASAGKLVPAERVELLGNARALLESGAIDGATYLRTLGVMHDDPNPQVLEALAGAVENVHQAFVTPDLEDAFAAWVRGTLGPGLDRMGRDPRESEPEAVTLVRPRLVGALADWGERKDLRAWAHGVAVDWLDNPADVDPSVARTALGIAALDGDADLLARYREAFATAEDSGTRRLLIRAMASFRDPKLRDGFLEWALENVRPEDFSGIFFTMADTEDGRDACLRFVRERWEWITASASEERLGFLPMLAAGCSEQRLEAAREFFGDPGRAVAGTESALRRVSDSVGDCVRLRQREGDSVAAFLRGFAQDSGGTR